MTEKKKIIRIDENRILTYSTLAAAILGSPSVEASISKNPVDPDEVVKLETFGIDFDGGGDVDVNIHHATHTVYNLIAQAEPLDGNIAAKVGLASAMSSGYIINATLGVQGAAPDWGGNNASLILGATTSGFFPPAGVDKYIGVKFKIGTETHYGWILVFVGSSTDSVIVREFAYETVADLGLSTGSDTSLPVVLSEFKGLQEGKSVVINWSTDSEQENIGFILERRATGSADWKQIAHFDSDPELEGQGSKVTRTDYSFVDKNVEIGGRYSYRLTDVSYQVMYKGISRIIQDIEVNPLVASSFKLHPSYPNPFNPYTTVGFTLDKPGAVKLSVYNLKGQLVESLLDEERTGGYHEVDWNASDMDAGVYFVEIVAGDHRQMQKITLVK